MQVLVASTPRVLGEFDASDHGVLDAVVTIPADLEGGVHSLVAVGLSSGIGFRQSFSLDAIDPSPSALPTTGTDSARIVGLGAVLLGLGLVLTFTVRRRERRHVGRS